jgi:hypothetical protein
MEDGKHLYGHNNDQFHWFVRSDINWYLMPMTAVLKVWDQ